MKNETFESDSLRTQQHHTGSDWLMIEPFVKPEVVGEFLHLDDATVVRYANAGFFPGYPLREFGKRTHWRFLLSEIKQSMLSKQRTRRVAMRPVTQPQTDLLKHSPGNIAYSRHSSK